MEIINIALLVLLFSYFGGILSTIFYIKIIDLIEIKHLDSSRKNLLKIIFVPFLSIFKIKKTNFTISYLLGLIFLILFIVSTLINFFHTELNQNNIYEIIFFILINFLLTILLLYLSIFDLLNFAIPEKITRFSFFYILFFSIIISILKILDSNFFNKLLNMGSLESFLGFILTFVIFSLIVFITKEKGMGAGDIAVAGFISLILGWPSSLVFIFSTFILGGIIALFYTLIIGKFKGVIIPFVPILTLGYLISLGFSNIFLNFLKI